MERSAVRNGQKNQAWEFGETLQISPLRFALSKNIFLDIRAENPTQANRRLEWATHLFFILNRWTVRPMTPPVRDDKGEWRLIA